MACNFTNLLPGSETSAHKMLSQDKPLGKVTYTVMASDWSHLSTIISSVCTEAPGWHGDEVSKAGRYTYYIEISFSSSKVQQRPYICKR